MNKFEEFGFLKKGVNFILYPGRVDQQIYVKRDESYFQNIKNKSIFIADFDMLCLVVNVKNGKIE